MTCEAGHVTIEDYTEEGNMCCEDLNVDGDAEMKWKTDKNDGVRTSKVGVFECIVFKGNKWWDYGIMSKSGSETWKQGHAFTPETCMRQCEKWIKNQIKTIYRDLRK